MPELAVAPVDHRLTRETAVLAGRLAERLGDVAADGDALSGAASFLRSMAGAADELAVDAGAPIDEQPLDRLVAGLECSPVEVDLLVLPGLAEEPQGYAGVLRRISPTGEPFPTAGLAAQLFCVTREERPLLREVLECGPAVRGGAPRGGGEGAFYE